MKNPLHISTITLQQFCKGDNLALGHLYHTFLPKLYLIAYRYVQSQQEAEDVVADCFEKLFKMPIEKRKQKFIEEEIDIKALLIIMVKNRCLDVIKTKNNRNRIAQGIKKLLPVTSFNSVSETITEENFKLLLDCLPQKEKTVLAMNIQGFSNEEIAEQLQLSEKTISNILSMARKKVKELWGLFME
ncbi:sigma-70 family RNA polymerase sigma factor [uncultured Flavobacterium sp.]|uniref:RNA polymerase sigma factor n=1 Tax=uncultured Flavobacterium sp. TaxID=165435 RepID=UPI002612901E|nr:sigma-70 family RNA polymerase sigma factor [uncultured Flavobacterium sp.]